MKVKISEYDIETDLDDVCQAFDAEKEDILNSINEGESFDLDDLIEIYKEDESGILEAELNLDGNPDEIFHCINNLQSVKGNEFVFIRKYYFYNTENEDEEYSVFDIYRPFGGTETNSFILVGGIYDHKAIATKEEEEKYWGDQEECLLMGNAKYNDSYLLRSKDFEKDKWIKEWLIEDKERVDGL